jgi:hypothetical protein
VRTYIDISYAAGGSDPITVDQRLKGLTHVELLAGSHDIAFDWDDIEQFTSIVRAIHEALAGTGASYRVQTEIEESVGPLYTVWPPTMDEHVGAPRMVRKRSPLRDEDQRIR